MIEIENFRNKYQKFVDTLPRLDSDKYAKLYTKAQNKPFKVFKNSSASIVVQAFAENASNMVITLNQLEKVKFENGKYLYSSYEPILLDRIINQEVVENSEIKVSEEIIINSAINILSLNQILYGPPGTGKTYNTINRALKIIDGEIPDDRSAAKSRFEELQKAGQIEFVTFHQSYGYEEFVEGIKAQSLDGEISYDIESGIFKKLALRSQKRNSTKEKEYKLNAKSLNIQAELIEDNKDTYRVLSGSKIRKGEAPSFRNYNYSALKSLVLKEAKYKEENEFYILKEDYIFQSLSAASSVVLGRQSNGYNDWIEVIETDVFSEDLKNHIIIIDEINRGNISKIFGELITLIEPSKRIGAEEEIRVRLPYSDDEFGVPSNLYIIGTMNTADRSIALLDTALRRRFEFVEMMPDVGLLDFSVSGVYISKLLQKINARVEYLYDREHTIGHAYFMGLNTSSSLDDLNTVMRNKIIPLLQEYFYDDWEKILLVLNDGFIQRTAQDVNTIFDTIDDEYIEEDKFLYSVKSEFKEDAYLKIYDKMSKSEEE